jgi:hypothetical protein
MSAEAWIAIVTLLYDICVAPLTWIVTRFLML